MTGEHMRNKLAGVSLMGLIVVLVVLAVIALFGMKVIPSYMEFRGMKNAIQSIAREKPNGTPAEVRKSFEARMNGVLAAQREAHANWQFGAGERRAARPNEHHWLAVLDVDGFRSVNDRFGHLYGDDVLMLLARQMMRSFRLEDRLFRFGGKEFVILLSPCAAAGAVKLLERFRSVMEDYEFPRAERLTVSIGFCRILPEDAASIALGRAGEALHYAKRNGRNRVCSFERLAATGDVHEPGVAASAPARN